MAVEIQYPRGIVVKCRHCAKGDSAPDWVCHHCGAPFCDKTPPIAPSPEERLKNVEFAGIDLDDRRSPLAFHCPDHQHGVPRRGKWLVRFGVLALSLGGVWFAALQGWLGVDLQDMAGVVVGPAEITPDLALAGFGLLLIVLGRLLRWLTFTQGAKRQRPPFPLLPAWERLERVEHMTVSINLAADGAYTAQASPISGAIKLVGRLSSADRDRWRQFRKRYGRRGSDNYVASLGFLALSAGNTVEFRSDDQSAPGSGILKLTNRSSQFPSLQDDKADLAMERQYTYQANLQQPHSYTDWSVPLRMGAVFVARSSRREIELVFQFRPDLASCVRRVEQLTLTLNPAWGNVQEARPEIGVAPVRRDAAGPQVNVHRWSRVVPDKEGVPTFAVRFVHPIDQADTLTGSFEILLKEDLADLTILGVYNALGHELPGINESCETILQGTFVLAAAALSYPQEQTGKAEVVQRGAIPDYRLTGELARLLADDGFYVKNLEENPPSDSRAGAHIQLRAWDIKGRRYLGLQPVDFHLVVTGEEHYGSDDVPDWGITRVEINTHGTVAAAEMAQQVLDTTYRIEDIVREALGHYSVGQGPELLAPSVHAPTEASRETIGADNYDTATVRRRLEQLETLFMAGKITPEQYMDLKDKYERLAQYASGRGGI